MPRARLSDGAELNYREYCFADPWSRPDTVVLLHGYVRNGNFWYGWVPTLARRYRVLVPDLRGCGESTVPEQGFKWSLRQYHLDLVDFLDATGTESAHVVGESMGGMVMPYFANWYPDRLKSIVACSSNLGVKGVMAKEMSAGAASMTDAITSAPTLVDYIRRTEGSRLAADEVTEEARAWYAQEWARTPRRIWEEWSAQLVPTIDVSEELLCGVEVPLLFIAASRTVKLPLSEAQFWVDHTPHGRLEIVDSASQGLAFAKPERCAEIALGFLQPMG